MKAIEKIIISAQSVGILAAVNNRPGSNHRTLTTNGDSQHHPAKPFVLNGKKFSFDAARQYIAARERRIKLLF